MDAVAIALAISSSAVTTSHCGAPGLYIIKRASSRSDIKDRVCTEITVLEQTKPLVCK